MNGIFHCNQFKFEDAVHGYVNPVFFMQNNRIQNNAAGITLEDIKLKAQNRILLNMEKQQQHAACEIKTPVKPRAETGVGVNEGLQTSLKQLMVVLEPHLLSDDGSVRRNAMLLLGLVLTRCTSLPVSQPLAERIVGFCAQRLFDWFSVEGAMLVYLGLLEHHLPVVAAGNVEKRVLQQDKKCASSDSDTDKTTESDGACSTPCPRVILTSVLRHVHAPSFAQPIRKNTLQVLTLLLDAFPDHVRAVGRKVVPRIFCQVENEKDPRNLMISFPLIEKLLRDFSDLIGEESKDSGLCILKKKKVEDETTQCLDMIADVLLSYFPIRFKPVHSNVYNVTETDLQFRLARCFIANIALSSRLLDGFLDFLNDNLAPQQRENIHDAVEAICSCVEYYQNTQLAQSYTRPFFDVIKLAAWHTPCAELPLLASGFARILALASQCPKATSINHTLQPCVSVLLSPAENGVALSSQEFAAARCIVCASAKASPRLLLPIVTSLFSEDEKKHFLGRLLISLADLRKTQESAVAQTPETRVQKTSVDARNEMRSALQLWTRITTDLDVLKELTVIIRLHIAQHPLQLIHLMPQLNATLNILLDLACTYSVAFVVEYDCNKTAGGILLFESIVNLLLCVASFVRPENPDHEPNASNVCRRAVGFLGCALGFPLPAEAPPDFPHWAVCWQEALQRRFKNKVNELHAAFDPLLQITENGLIGSSRLLPRVVEDVLWDGVSSLLQSFVTNKDSAERHAGDTLSNFLLGTAVKLSAIWVFEGCPLLDDAKQYSKLLQTLFEVVFCSIDYANRQLNDFGSEALTQNAFVAQLCLTLNTLRERLMDSSVVLSVDILDCAMGFVARILSNHAILASISRVLAALACNVQLSRKASFDPTSLLGLFVDVITLIVQRSDALSTLLTFLHQLVEADTLIDSTEHRQLPAATLFVISILPRLFALNVLGRCPEAEGSLNKVLTLASDITCSSDSSRGEAQEFVVAGMRKMLSVFLVHGPAEYVTTIALRVTTASSEAESPRQLLNTAILRGHVAQSLIVRAAAHEDSDDSAFAEIQHLLIDLIKECQSSKKTHKLLPFSLFVPAIVLRSALSSDLYPMSPNHSLTPSVKVGVAEFFVASMECGCFSLGAYALYTLSR